MQNVKHSPKKRGDSDFATCLGLETVILLHVLAPGTVFLLHVLGRDSDFTTWDIDSAT